MRTPNGETFSYVAYGLGIRSDLALPPLLVAERATEVTVRFGLVRPLIADDAREGLVRATEGEVDVFFRQAGAFSIREGREIVIDPVPEADERVLCIGTLGPAMGALLFQRGLLTLHASSVAVAGEAVAFIGERGWGKSTMAAAMYARGHSLVADDLTAVQINAEGPIVFPGYPQLKLWPESTALLGDKPETLPRLNPHLERRARRATREFSPASIPLKRIYVLGESKVPEIEPLGPQEALVQLIQHSYGRRLFPAVRTSSHFLQCTSIVKNVPVCSLRRPYSLPVLSDVAQLVEEDLAQSSK